MFFYGLFMDAEHLRAHHVHAERPRVAVVRDMELRLGARATLWPRPGGRAYGVVAELTRGDIERLYAAPSLGAYRPEAVLAEPTEGAAVPALCYTLEEPPPPAARDATYAAELRVVARHVGLPAEYVERIR